MDIIEGWATGENLHIENLKHREEDMTAEYDETKPRASGKKRGKKEMQIIKETCAKDISVSREPRTLPIILSQEVTDIQDEILPVAEMVKEASRGLLETTQYGDLQEAAEIIGSMSHELDKLKPPSFFERIPFLGKNIEKKILVRKSIKEVLENAMENYRGVANKLKTNIASVLAIEDSSIRYAEVLEAAIERLEAEKKILDEAIASWDKDDVRGLINAQSKTRAYQASISNATTFLRTQRDTTIQCGVQRQTREMLYSTMTSLAPQVETLANQQLTMIVSGNEVSTAVKINNAAIESTRTATVISARMMRQNAEDVAAAAYSPIIDEATLEASKKEIIAMVGNVRKIIEQALAEGSRAADTARKGEREIEEALLGRVSEKTGKSSRIPKIAR